MSPLRPEFSGPTELTPLDRREFLQAMGLLSSMGLLASCGQKAEHIYPFAQEQKEFTHKDFEFYSTAIESRGFAQGLLVKSFQGRPIKVEGHPQHPFSLGATTPQAQAMLFDLYQPKRLSSTLSEVAAVLPKEDEGLVVWYRPIHSPSFQALLKELHAKFPQAHFICESPEKTERWNLLDLTNAEEIISFDEDLFSGRPDSLRLARQIMDKRQASMEKNSPAGFTKLVSYHSSPNLFAAKANESHLLTPQEIWNRALELRHKKTSASAVFISPSLHPDAQDLEAEINQHLSSSHKSLHFPLLQTLTLAELAQRLQKGEVKKLLCLEADPYLWYPQLVSNLRKTPSTVTLSSMATKTTTHSQSVIAAHHPLEYWSDLLAVDGSVSIQQPLIKPLFHGIDPYGLLLTMLGRAPSSYDYVKHRHETNWAQLIQEGHAPQMTAPFRASAIKPTPLAAVTGLQLKLVPDGAIGFGASESNPLLQEMPRAFSNLTWQNAYALSISDGERLKLKDFDVVQIKQGDRVNSGPVVILPHIAPGVVVATLGYGSSERGTDNFGFVAGSIELKKTLRTKRLARSQDDLSDKDHAPIQKTALPAKAKASVIPASLYPEHPLPHQEQGPQWGMTIDLESCIGCSSCVIACQVENNVPFVGEEQVAKGRIMHWLRIDTYQIGSSTQFQPVPCMHCEKAPCEVVCPVNATVHGNGGLNEMVYNRCVGTRYCSNNCPYRVRRFNFRAYSVLKYPITLGLNPEVSVRDRGVMEKCTYCVQRLKTKDPTPACAQVCPTRAITFGDIRDKNSLVAKAKASPRHYELLEGEGVRPRTTYLKVIQRG